MQFVQIVRQRLYLIIAEVQFFEVPEVADFGGEVADLVLVDTQHFELLQSLEVLEGGHAVLADLELPKVAETAREWCSALQPVPDGLEPLDVVALRGRAQPAQRYQLLA
jgi:hypothetical protein